jgi:tRNA pseudouridine38-40 synthase
LKKFKLLLEYDGAAYHGWQLQKEGETLQGILEDRIHKVTGRHSRIIGASRTDAGVHALGQVATFRTETELDFQTIKRALNAVLPPDIRVIDASEVEDSFRPRHDAVRKSYFYIIANQVKPSVFLCRYSWPVIHTLDLSSMMEAAQVLVGRHDFSSFMGTGSSIKDPVREIYSLTIEKYDRLDFMTAVLEGNFIKLRIEANGFLRHMVRNIVGTLVEMGRGRIFPDKMKEILEAHDRRLAGQTAPANALFLERIVY